jgi:A/G-specific adenine glycosylase
VLVSEVMLHQTQASRVEAVWPAFLAEFPNPAVMAAKGPGDVIRAWGRLGYPRRARRLWEAAVRIAAHGWPEDLTELPGVGRYTAGALRAQADDADVPAVDVNVRRVLERVAGRRLTMGDAEAEMGRIGRPLHGRDRLLALMDVGALLCRPTEPRCDDCPLRPRCATRGPLPDESRSTQRPFDGSFRQRRGLVLARLRAGPTPLALLDDDALQSLRRDGLAVVDETTARLP